MYTTAAKVKVELGRPFSDDWLDADIEDHITQAEDELKVLLRSVGVVVPVVSPTAELIQLATVWSANHIIKAQGHLAPNDPRATELAEQVKTGQRMILGNPGCLGVPLVDRSPGTYADDPTDPSVSDIGLP